MANSSNPTRWKAVYIPEELYKDLEDTATASGVGVGEAATLLIITGAQAMFTREMAENPELREELTKRAQDASAGSEKQPEPAA